MPKSMKPFSGTMRPIQTTATVSPYELSFPQDDWFPTGGQECPTEFRSSRVWQRLVAPNDDQQAFVRSLLAYLVSIWPNCEEENIVNHVPQLSPLFVSVIYARLFPVRRGSP